MMDKVYKYNNFIAKFFFYLGASIGFSFEAKTFLQLFLAMSVF